MTDNTDETSDVDVTTEDLDEGEWRQFNAGGHFIQIWVDDGNIRINIRDHAQIAIEGDHKDRPLVAVAENEFPTLIQRISEREFWERYDNKPDSEGSGEEE